MPSLSGLGQPITPTPRRCNRADCNRRFLCMRYTPVLDEGEKDWGRDVYDPRTCRLYTAPGGSIEPGPTGPGQHRTASSLGLQMEQFNNAFAGRNRTPPLQQIRMPTTRGTTGPGERISWTQVDESNAQSRFHHITSGVNYNVGDRENSTAPTSSSTRATMRPGTLVTTLTADAQRLYEEMTAMGDGVNRIALDEVEVASPTPPVPDEVMPGVPRVTGFTLPEWVDVDDYGGDYDDDDPDDE